MSKRTKKVIIVMVLVIVFVIIGVVALIFNPHTCSKRIVSSIENEENFENFEECVRNNIRGVNSTYYGTQLWRFFDDRNYYPIHYAIKKGDYNKVRILLEHGADPNMKDPTVDKTPLEFAFESGTSDRFRIAKLLIENGAGCEIGNEGREFFLLSTILTIYDSPETKKEGFEFVKEMIISTEYKENRDKYEPVLVGAASYGNMDLVDYLLENDIDNIDAMTSSGETALIGAAQGNQADICKRLVYAGADQGIKSNEGKTAYDYAVQYDYRDIINILQ